MPASILALVLFGWLGLGLSLAAAVLLGAVMAPTDPVLASDVQVGPPGTGDDDEVRFGLTAEAGLNDGLAFPFVHLAITLAVSGLALGGLTEWLLVPVLWKVVAGVGGGLVFGAILGGLVFRVGEQTPVSDGFFALTLTLLTYGVTELIQGYGFLAVFVAALVFRRFERDHEIHHALHDFSEQIERLLMAAILILLGAALMDGLLAPLSPLAIVGALGFIVLARPIAGWLGLIGVPLDGPRRGAIAVLGIRGIGSFYYLAYGLNSGAFDEAEARILWAIAGLIVVVSIALHGATAGPLLRRVRPEGSES